MREEGRKKELIVSQELAEKMAQRQKGKENTMVEFPFYNTDR